MRYAVWFFLTLALTGAARAQETDFYLIAGQSNAIAEGASTEKLGSTTLGDVVPETFVWLNANRSTTTMRFGVNTSQFPAKRSQQARFGPEWGMGKEHRRLFPGRRALFMKFARGGTSLLDPAEWNPDGPDDNLAYQLVDELSSLRKDWPQTRALCLVWVQGESDRTSEPAAYEAAFRRLAHLIRAAAGAPGARVVWPLLTEYGVDRVRPETIAFREMQRRLEADPALNLSVVETDDLVKVDPVHFDAPSTFRLGQRLLRACHEEEQSAQAKRR